MWFRLTQISLSRRVRKMRREYLLFQITCNVWKGVFRTCTAFSVVTILLRFWHCLCLLYAFILFSRVLECKFTPHEARISTVTTRAREHDNYHQQLRSVGTCSLATTLSRTNSDLRPSICCLAPKMMIFWLIPRFWHGTDHLFSNF